VVSEFDIPDLEYFNLAENLHINKNSWIEGFIEGPYGRIPVLKSSLDKLDRLGAIKVRLGIERDSYSVLPGLYAIGSPDKSSPVLVTANYKLTLDMLRKELKGVNAWIVVVDTKGINVWCAAGKGTFSTYEVIKKTKELKLKDLVNHRKIILPQLCASGVAAYQVLKNSGFKAVFGPIRAEDIKIFLQNGMKSTEEMRTVTFNAQSRLVLTPVEVVHNIKLLMIMLAAVLAFHLVDISTVDISSFIYSTFLGFIPLASAVLTGCILLPLLLPFIPFRAFAAKGLLLGLLLDVLLIYFKDDIPILANNWLLITAYCFIIPAATALLSLNFTGSSTYTSFSGVKKETKLVLPMAKTAIALGLLLAIAGRLL
jgi:hypothetical protein